MPQDTQSLAEQSHQKLILSLVSILSGVMVVIVFIFSYLFHGILVEYTEDELQKVGEARFVILPKYPDKTPSEPDIITDLHNKPDIIQGFYNIEQAQFIPEYLGTLLPTDTISTIKSLLEEKKETLSLKKGALNIIHNTSSFTQDPFSFFIESPTETQKIVPFLALNNKEFLHNLQTAYILGVGSLLLGMTLFSLIVVGLTFFYVVDPIRHTIEVFKRWQTEKEKHISIQIKSFNEIGYLQNILNIFHRNLQYTGRKNEENNFFYKKISDLLPSMVWMTNERGFINFINKPWLTYTGKPYRDLLGYGWKTIIHPEDLLMLEQILTNPPRHESNQIHHVVRFQNADGAWRMLKIDGHQDKTEEGAFKGYVLALEDISDRLSAEEMLRVSEQRYRNIYVRTPAMLYSLNHKGVIISATDHWLEKIGYERSEVIGRRAIDFMDDECCDRELNEIMPLFIREGRLDNLEYRFICKNGELVHVVLSAIAEYDDKHRFVRSVVGMIDISERIRISHIAQRQHEELKRVYNKTPAMMLQFNNHNKIISVSDYLLENMHYNREQTINHRLIDFISIEYFEDFTDKILPSLIETGFTNQVQIRFKTGLGTELAVYFSAIAEYDDNGNFIGALCVLTDITEILRMEEDLRKQQNELQLIFDNVPVGITYKDDDNTILRINNLASEEMGFPPMLLENTNLYDIMPLQAERVHKDDLEVIESGKPRQGDIIMFRKIDGKIRWLLMDKVPYFDFTQKKRYILTMTQDITDIYRQGQAIEAMYRISSSQDIEFDDRINAILELAIDYLQLDSAFVSQVQGNRVTILHGLSNQGTENCVGDSYEWGETLCHYIYDEQDVVLYDILPDRNEFESKKYHGVDVECLAGGAFYVDGQRYGCISFIGHEKRVKPFADRERSFVRLVVQWIGAQMSAKQAFERIKSSEQKLEYLVEELTHKNNQLERFVYIASHDMQEPLRTVNNFASLIQRRYGEQLEGKAKEYLGFISEGAVRMLAMIKDLLEYSRITTTSIELQPVNLNEILNVVATNLTNLTQEKKAQIQIEGPLPIVMGNTVYLNSLFQNLVTNAIKYCPDTRSPIIHVHITDNGKNWVCHVQDNGLGIKKEYHEQIFVAFKRLHDRQHISGTGVGLAICKRIIEMMGGEIWLDSEDGIGTTFHFTLQKAQSISPASGTGYPNIEEREAS